MECTPKRRLFSWLQSMDSGSQNRIESFLIGGEGKQDPLKMESLPKRVLAFRWSNGLWFLVRGFEHPPNQLKSYVQGTVF